ncbi:MAG: [Muribaculaceae bacterium]|nr:[citrate (pro-3S)-lyase] ligase [Muribaculaceae bacterium]
MFNNYDIVEMPLTLKRNRTMVENFLAKSDLRLDDMDYYAAVVDRESYSMLAGGGFKDDIIKCIAVDDSLRGTGMSQQLISHLMSQMNVQGHNNVKVFTKPGNIDIFESLGFKTLGESSKAILLENGLYGLSSYVSYLKSLKREGKNGIIVMNANPFTLGHQYLVEQAAAQVDNLYVIVVAEDKSLFSSDERQAMVTAGCAYLKNVTVCRGSSYIISAATFPSYFIKQASDAALAQIELDLDITARHIVPALGATVRFVGSEPSDELTRAYNSAMHDMLPQRGITVIELPRLEKEGNHISASAVRLLLKNGNLLQAKKFVPGTTLPYLVAWLAINALKQELDLTPKPGLVDTHDNGSHSDMDYAIMLKSINALRSYFAQLAVISFSDCLPEASQLQNMGIDAEKKMLAATGGINTHRGALFSMGLAVVAACHILATGCSSNFLDQWCKIVASIASQMPGSDNSHGNSVKAQHNVAGALDIARTGYSEMVNKWLEYYCDNCNDEQIKHKTLLLIMCSLDDTNVIHRAGFEMALQVKQEAAHLLENFSIEGLEQMNQSFIARNISPGGAADMLSLTLFLSTLTKQDNN